VSDVVFLPEQLNSVLVCARSSWYSGSDKKFAAPAVFWPLFPCGGGQRGCASGRARSLALNHPLVETQCAPVESTFPGDQALDVGDGPETHQRSAGIFADHEPVWTSLLNSGSSLFSRFVLLDIQPPVHFRSIWENRCFLIVGEVAADLIFLLPPRNNFGQELAHGRFLRLLFFAASRTSRSTKGFSSPFRQS